jgi:hypothetical protein
VLVCNRPDAADELLSRLQRGIPPASLTRLARLHGRASALTLTALKATEIYSRAVHNVGAVGLESGDLLAGSLQIGERG